MLASSCVTPDTVTVRPKNRFKPPPHSHPCHPHTSATLYSFQGSRAAPTPRLGRWQRAKGTSGAKSHLERYGLANKPLLVPASHLHTLCPSHT